MTSTYPLKVVSRSLAPTRSNKIRISWFVVGTAFGIGCTSALTPALSSHSLFHSSSIENSAPATNVASDMPDVPLPENVAILEPVSPPAAVVADVPEQQIADAAPQNTYPMTVTVKVKNGDTLLNMLTDAGATSDDAYSVIESMKKSYDPKKLDIGQNLTVTLDKAANDATPLIANLSMPLSVTSSLEITRKNDNDFAVKKVDAPVERKLARAGGEINSSLYETGIENNIPPALLADIINAYSYDVDFQRDIKQGDAMDVLYERMETKDGAVAGHGDMLFAELDLGDRVMKIYNYKDADGHSDYYNEKGESIRKALLRTPVNGAKITSGYGMRNHPILGYTKMHRGVDFGAPIGTPIYAAGDGTVDFVGKRGGYGNYVRIKHNNTYSTAYAHISRFAEDIHPGGHVKQGQIIAYVGATGMATGPHLHYEILVNNEQVNPANVKFKTGNVLAGKELNAFRKNMEKIEARLSSSPRNGNVAMIDTDKTDRIN